jgi:hypothetical protein
LCHEGRIVVAGLHHCLRRRHSARERPEASCGRAALAPISMWKQETKLSGREMELMKLA